MKHIIALIIAVSLIMSCGILVAQADEITPYSSNQFASYGTTLSKQGGGVIQITFSTTGVGMCSVLGVASYYVMKLTDDGWMNVSGLLYGETGSNVPSYTFSRYFYGVAGETYKVQCTFTCTNSYGYGTRIHTSGRVTAN